MAKYYLAPTNGRKSFYGKAYVLDNGNGSKSLYSYDTLVCGIHEGKVQLYPMWDCSITTLTHVRAFLKAEGFEIGSKAEMTKLYA